MPAAARSVAPAIALGLAPYLLTSHPAPISANQVTRAIEIATTQELYAAVDNPANRDASLRLRTGTYLISRPLRLQPGMELAGENRYQDVDKDGVWDRSASGGWTSGGETVLDARAMTAISAITRDCNAGGMTAETLEPAIAITGRNRIGRVTILSPPAGIGIGEANHLRGDARAGIEFTIEDTVVEGGIRGVTMSNRGCEMRHFRSSFTFDRNVVAGARFALTIVNFLTDQRGSFDGPGIVANIRHNRFTGNETGVTAQAGAQGTDGGQIDLGSLENLFEKNSAGALIVRAAVSQAVAQQPSSNRNSVRFSSTGDRFVGNPAPAVMLTASDRLANGTMSGGENHDNRLDAEFLNLRIDGAAPGLLAIGGRYGGTGARSGTSNVVTLVVRAAGMAMPSIQTEDDNPAVEGVTPPNRVQMIKD